MTSIEDSLDASKGKGESAGQQQQQQDDKTNLIRSLNVANADNLEARVRKELEEQGILAPGEDDGSARGGGESDEILDELRRCQGELRAVSAHNLAQLKRVLQVGSSSSSTTLAGIEVQAERVRFLFPGCQGGASPPRAETASGQGGRRRHGGIPKSVCREVIYIHHQRRS